MITIEKLIGDLLVRYNCIILPGFGGFVAKQISAKINLNSGIATPPSKSILFNKQLINNDGLFVSHFAQVNQISYDASQQEIQHKVNEWNSMLAAGNRISIDKVGYIYLDQEKNICFEQDRFSNLLLGSFGLSSLHFIPQEEVSFLQQFNNSSEQVPVLDHSESLAVQEEKSLTSTTVLATDEQLENVTSLEEKATPQLELPQTKHSFWKYAAAVLLIPFLFYSLWIPMKTDVLESKMISFHDFNPFHKQETASYKSVSAQERITKVKQQSKTRLEEQLKYANASNDNFSYQFSEDTYVNVKLEQKNPQETTDNQISSTSNESESTLANQSQNNYHFIIGCFSDDTNASNLVKELINKGFNASIVDKKGGLNRVSIGGASTMELIQQLAQKATDAGYAGWILK